MQYPIPYLIRNPVINFSDFGRSASGTKLRKDKKRDLTNEKTTTGNEQCISNVYDRCAETFTSMDDSNSRTGQCQCSRKNTEELAYLAVMAALRLESGVPFHTQMAKQAGASRDEVISVILVGLPAAGNGATQVLPAALAAYDAGK